MSSNCEKVDEFTDLSQDFVVEPEEEWRQELQDIEKM